MDPRYIQSYSSSCVTSMEMDAQKDAEDAVENKSPAVNDGVKDSTKSWLLCLSSSVNLILISGLLIASSPVFFIALLDEFGESKQSTAWVGSVGASMMSIPGPIAALLSRRFGSRKTIFCASLIMLVGFFASSFASNVIVICLTFSVVGGFGCGIIYTLSFSDVTRSFDKYQSFAIGLLSAGPAVGWMILPPLIRYLISCIGLWDTYRVISGMCLICLFMSYNYPSDVPRMNNNHVRSSSCLPTVSSLFKISSYRAVIAFYTLTYFVYYIPLQHMLLYAEEEGVPKARTSTFIAYSGIATGICRILIGQILDRFKHIDFLALYISQASLVGLGLATIIMCHTNNYYSFLIYYILYGVFDAGFFGQQCLIVLKCIETPEQLPMAWGIFSAFEIVIMLGGPVGGLLADVSGSYYTTFYFAGVTVIVTGLLLSLVPWFKRNTKVQPSVSECLKSVVTTTPSDSNGEAENVSVDRGNDLLG